MIDRRVGTAVAAICFGLFGASPAEAKMSKSDCRLMQNALSVLELSMSQLFETAKTTSFERIVELTEGDDKIAARALQDAQMKINADGAKYISAIQDLNYRMQVCAR